MFHQLNRSFLSDSPTYGSHFHTWKDRDDVRPELAVQVEIMGRQFVYNFLKDAKHRLRPYWKFLLASETISPCAPADINPSAWEGVEDLCRRAKLSEDKIREVIKELKEQHEDQGEWDRATRRDCKANLLRFYRDRLQDDRGVRFGNANTFAQIVFSIHYASSVIESFFSKTKYIKNKHRASMTDELASATLHLQQLKVLIDAEKLQNSDTLATDFQRALNYIETNLTALREKYVDKPVVKKFENENGVLREYRGHISSLDWSRVDGEYLFHVVYDSDSDEEDMELWEVRKYVRD